MHVGDVTDVVGDIKWLIECGSIEILKNFAQDWYEARRRAGEKTL